MYSTGQPRVLCMLQVINTVRSRLNQKPNGYCTENHELHYQKRLGAFKRQAGQNLTITLKENRENIKIYLLSYGKQHYKEILFTDEKMFTV